MKALIAAVSAMVFLCLNLNAQTTENQRIEDPKSDQVIIESNYSDVNITSWDQNYIQVSSTVSVSGNDVKDKFNLDISNTSSAISIDAMLNTEGLEQQIVLTDKDGNRTYISPEGFDNLDMDKRSVNGINFGYDIDASLEISVPKGMKLDVNTLYGDIKTSGSYKSIKSHSTYGMIEGRFDDIDQMSNIELLSTYDIIDIALEESSSATLNLSTSYGDIFSDLPMIASGMSGHHSHSTCGDGGKFLLNDGKVKIDLVSTYDNIYVRKNK